MIYLYALAMLAINLVWLALNLVGLPGNWLMIFTAGLLAWSTWDRGEEMFSSTTLILVVAIALAGEAAEFALSAAGAKKAGSTLWGAVGSIIGAVIGGIAGTVIIPIPVIGSIVGACGGAFAGALALESLTGKPLVHAIHIGKGAAIGRLWGTLAKLAAGVLIYIALALAAVVP